MLDLLLNLEYKLRYSKLATGLGVGRHQEIEEQQDPTDVYLMPPLPVWQQESFQVILILILTLDSDTILSLINIIYISSYWMFYI